MYEWKKIGTKIKKIIKNGKIINHLKISSKENFLDSSLKEAINNEKKIFIKILNPLLQGNLQKNF